jgi:putative ABC transport system permease protein
MFSRITSILRLTLEEFGHNKIRTFLSLLGITIGVFCIISVLATTDSLERNVKDQMKALGVNTIFIQKMPWGGGGGPNSWWKYIQRPNPKYEEIKFIRDRATHARYVAFSLFNGSKVEYETTVLDNVIWYGVSEDFNKIQDVEIAYGRYISPVEFHQGSSVVVIGYENAIKLFDQPERALGKTIELGTYKCQVIGIIKKKGRSLIGGWDFDNIVLVSTEFCKRLSNYRKMDGFIMVQAYENYPLQMIKDELRGIMRSVRRLSPKQEDNFALNDVSAGSDSMNSFFGQVSLGGWFIALLSLIVGGFGVANIMFVSVRERTSIIGLKKAIGAKRRTILFEFLLESAFLCIIGGLIGVMLVWPMTLILSNVFKFDISLSWNNIALSIIICVILGVLSGIIPASIAAKMNPVVAIRSK